MKRTRHQLAPAMPVQKVVDRAVAGRMPDSLLIGRLEVVDVQHLTSPGGLGKARQQRLLLGHRHALAQQYHLNALTLCRRNFPVQHRLQLPDLGLAAFDHLSPSESDGQSESHHAPRRQFPSVSDKITVKTSIQSVMEAVSDMSFWTAINCSTCFCVS